MSEAKSPRELGFAMPAEWEAHSAVWLAWPSHPHLWGSLLPEVQSEMVGLCRGIADPDETGQPRGEALHVLVPDAQREREAREALAGLGAELHRIPFGDIWTRDTGPIFLRQASALASVCFRFNGWGGKYRFPGDEEVASRIAELAPGQRFASALVLEGGAIEVDGAGTLLTTRQCLRNPNRNSQLAAAEIEAQLCEDLGVGSVRWLERGLRNDETDGHVDTLARFVEPGRVVCMEPRDEDDPNRAVLDEIARTLAGMRDHAGRRLQVERIPSPGAVLDPADGRLLPASYANFYIANSSVLVPTYGTRHDAEAVEALGALFPGRQVRGCSARAILCGGGALHCVTQQQPA